MRTLSAVIVLVVLVGATVAAAAPLTNADIVKLVKSGVSADVILAKIRVSETAFATDSDSLVALAHEKVPNSVIEAMVARSAATPVPSAAPSPAAANTPAPEVTQVVVKGIYRTRGICTARGDITMTPKTFAFKATEKSPVCSDEAFGHASAEFAWGDVSRICYEYAATGTMEVWLKSGDDLSFKATRGEIEDLAARIRSVRPDVPVRCEN
jgi:hypothetical protein